LATGGTITWANGKTTTVTLSISTTETDATEVKVCPAGTTEYEETGFVTADTTGSAPVGRAAKGEVCISDASANTRLELGTAFKFK
jgi:hypothetical protein